MPADPPATAPTATNASASASAASFPHIFLTDYDFAPPDQQRLRDALAPAESVFVAGSDALRAALAARPTTDLLCTFRPPDDTLSLAPNLRWLALPSAGAERILRMPLAHAPGLTITNASGVHTIPISEFVLSAILAWNHHWPAMRDLQREQRWPTREEGRALQGIELHDSTLLVVGLGAIGRGVARLARAFGMRVIAVRRSAQPTDTDPDVDALYSTAALRDALAQADYIVIAAPATPATEQLIGAPELAAMRPTAFLVNIARGSLIDEPALIAALRSGALAGAALDVFAQEPLPATSPLWSLPNALLSPHVSGFTAQYSRRLTDLLLDNLARYRSGQPLRNVVDPQRGY